MELTDEQKTHYNNLSDALKEHTTTFIRSGFEYDQSYMRALEERIEEIIEDYESQLDFKDAQIEDMIINNNIPPHIHNPHIQIIN